MRFEQLSAHQLLMAQTTSPDDGSLIAVNLTPASVGAATAAYQNFTVNGLRAGDTVICVDNPISNAVAAVASRCTTANTLAVQFLNPTAGALTPTAGVYRFLVIRPA